MMDEKDKKEIETLFKHHIGILSEDFQSKLDIVVEGHQMLNGKIDRMDQGLERVEERLEKVEVKVDALDSKVNALDSKVSGMDKKLEAVAADLAAHRADTESHRGAYRQRGVRNGLFLSRISRPSRFSRSELSQFRSYVPQRGVLAVSAVLTFIVAVVDGIGALTQRTR
jgi:hypothetical protein